jgi:hypothetical protein
MRNGSGCGCPLRDVPDGFAEVPAGKVELVGLLQIHPKIRAGPKVAGEPQGGIGRDGPPAGDDLRDAVGRDGKRTGQLGGGNTDLLQFVSENLADSSVVVDHFDALRPISSLRPFKTDAPLLVDADAVLPFPVARERLQQARL